MAKLGAGDPRWIVEEREDGKNVGSWHWEDISKIKWSKERLPELLVGVSSSSGNLSIVSIKSITGEASITTRKGNKRFPMFELAITAAYEGKVQAGLVSPAAASDKTVKGEIKIEEFTSHSDEDDFMFTVTVEGSGSEQDECKRTAEGLKPAILERLRAYVEEMNAIMAADETAAMTDSYCIVTGGNSGIGKEIVHGLTAKGAHVVMACRNMEACELVRAELAASGGPGSVACAQLDLEDFASVRACAAGQRAALQGAGRKLSVLVNNAGVMNVPDREGGEDRHMRANHYGPYLLTRLLVPSMGAGSRVVSVSSRAHTYGTIHFDVETGAFGRRGV
ncbi:hypothetical protein FOA52_006901 [Chlamydomonas sp. UWO 241]|nr:hypothetical protein FOA52_006901 [Chlamydomonas sp. UWO 241]